MWRDMQMMSAADGASGDRVLAINARTPLVLMDIEFNAVGGGFAESIDTRSHCGPAHSGNCGLQKRANCNLTIRTSPPRAAELRAVDGSGSGSEAIKQVSLSGVT